MTIGLGIFLLAAGAILTWAVEAEVSGLDINVIGVILMIAGGLGIVLGLLVFGPRNRRVVTSSTGAPVAGTTTVDQVDTI